MNNPYRKSVRHLDEIDIYQIGNLYEVKSHAVFHALKKLLCAGKRGAKDYEQDLMEAIESIERELQIVGLANAKDEGFCGDDPRGTGDFDESRIDVIGQNGNEGEHYHQEYNGPTWWMTCPSCKRLSVIGVDTLMPCTCCGVKFKVSLDDISKASVERKSRITPQGYGCVAEINLDWKDAVDWSTASPHHKYAFQDSNGRIAFSMHLPGWPNEYIERPSS